MAAIPWYRWFPQDFARDTRHMTMLERGAYRELLDHYYAMNGVMFHDPPALFRICGAFTAEEQAAVIKALEYFGNRDGFLVNKRADAEIAERQATMANQSARGKAGANARWNPSSNASSINQAMLADAHTHTHKTKPKPLRAASGTAFGRFWEVWPSSKRKVGRHKCEGIWAQRNLDLLADQIIAHVEAMKVTEQWRGGFEPSPLTYLNQRRWEDGAPESAPKRLAI